MTLCPHPARAREITAEAVGSSGIPALEVLQALGFERSAARFLPMLQDHAGKGRRALLVSGEDGACEQCSKACYIDCSATSARVHRACRHPVGNVRLGRTRTIVSDPSTPVASTTFLIMITPRYNDCHTRCHTVRVASRDP